MKKHGTQDLIQATHNIELIHTGSSFRATVRYSIEIAGEDVAFTHSDSRFDRSFPHIDHRE